MMRGHTRPRRFKIGQKNRVGPDKSGMFDLRQKNKYQLRHEDHIICSDIPKN